MNVQDCLVLFTVDSLFRSRNDLAEALELLKAQVNPSLTQEQEQEQNQAGPGSTSPTHKDTGMETANIEKKAISFFCWHGGEVTMDLLKPSSKDTFLIPLRRLCQVNTYNTP